MTHTLDIPAPADTTTDTMRAAVVTGARMLPHRLGDVV